MSASRMTVPDDGQAGEEDQLLERVVAAMERRVPTEEDRELLLALGRALRTLREERGMTPAELACAAGVRREELEAIEAGRPHPGRRRVRHRASKCA